MKIKDQFQLQTGRSVNNNKQTAVRDEESTHAMVKVLFCFVRLGEKDKKYFEQLINHLL
jgi:hypothetical protein